jgi:hypothetical protein
LVGDDRLKEVGDLPLAGRRRIKLAAHLSEPLIDMLAEVDEVLPKRIEARRGGLTELSKLAPKLTDVTIGGSGENARGRRIPLTPLYSARQVAHLAFQSAHA